MSHFTHIPIEVGRCNSEISFSPPITAFVTCNGTVHIAATSGAVKFHVAIAAVETLRRTLTPGAGSCTGSSKKKQTQTPGGLSGKKLNISAVISPLFCVMSGCDVKLVTYLYT